MELVIAARGPLAVGLVFGLGHLLRGLLELVLELDQRGQPRLDDFDQRLAGLEVGLLAQQADPDARPDEEVAVIGLIAGRPGVCISVVLPAPLGPTSPIRSPARTSNARS